MRGSTHASTARRRVVGVSGVLGAVLIGAPCAPRRRLAVHAERTSCVRSAIWCYILGMASMAARAPRPTKDKPQTSPPVRTAEPRPLDAKTRAQRLADAHAWVLENHAKTFEKLAK